MDERLPLDTFPTLRGPATHYALHVNLYLEPRCEFVRERLVPDANRLTIVVRDAAGGHDYRLTYYAADALQGTWQLHVLTRRDVEVSPAQPVPLAE